MEAASVAIANVSVPGRSVTAAGQNYRASRVRDCLHPPLSIGGRFGTGLLRRLRFPASTACGRRQRVVGAFLARRGSTDGPVEEEGGGRGVLKSVRYTAE